MISGQNFECYIAAATHIRILFAHILITQIFPNPTHGYFVYVETQLYLHYTLYLRIFENGI